MTDVRVFFPKMVGVLYLTVVAALWVTASCDRDCPLICHCLGNIVDCSKKNFETVPTNIPKWTTQLNLNNNRIRRLADKPWHNLTKLEELKLNRNNIAYLPENFLDKLSRLKILELNRNYLKDIKGLTFKSLTQLTTLKLKRNRITQLKDGTFFGLSKLRTLVLDYNEVQEISKGWLYGLSALRELSLGNNRINQIVTDAWEFCQTLEDLNLSYNQLTSITSNSFKYLQHLQRLNLNNNNISLIKEDAFRHLPELKLLQLNNNRLPWTIEDANGVFRGLNRLTRFHLSWNNIKSINKNAFVGLNNLELLDLNGNEIISVQKNAFVEMTQLKNLMLNTTSLLCDCNLQWFAEWLRAKAFKARAICSYPAWLRGVPLLDVPVNNFTCDELPKPRLIEQPEPEIMALKGENIFLICKAISSDPGEMTFQWKKNNMEITNGNITVTRTSSEDGNAETVSKLGIFKAETRDAGLYQCIVSNSFGTTYSQKSNISVLVFPTFTKKPSNITVRVDQTARLDCAAEGEPSPEIAWQKDGGNDFPAARERRMHVMLPTDDVFFIINIKPIDMGVYSCIAHNRAGTIVANASLVIEEYPSFVREMEDKEISAGESVVLQCMASGMPKPTIQWLKDGYPILPTERHFFTAEDQLMIIVDTLPSDTGTYQCQLNNSLGNKTGVSRLLVNADVINTSDMMGIIIITVVCCAVATSFVWVVIIYQTRKRVPATTTMVSTAPETAVDFTDRVIRYADNASENSSCKDSGTGDSAKRSNEDLLPDEYTLIISETNADENQPTTMRKASLVYSVPEGNNIHTPLLHTTEATYSRSTNHDRLDEKETNNDEAENSCSNKD